jgi:hypothetical protein
MATRNAAVGLQVELEYEPPSVSAAVSKKIHRSPLYGFSSTCLRCAITFPSWVVSSLETTWMATL